MASRRARIAGIVVVAFVVVGTAGGFLSHYEKSKVGVQLQKVVRRDLVSMVSASGEVKPKRFVDIGANVSGRIVEIAVVEGQPVKKGQVLARIEATMFAAGARQAGEAVRAARAELTRAEASAEVARLAFERMERMHREQLVSEQEYEQGRADFEMRRAEAEAQRRRIAQLSAASESTQDDLEKTTVTAPMDGVVTSLPKEEGEVVIGAQSFNPTVMMTVADLSVMECQIMVDETDIRHLELGLSAEVKVDALGDAKIAGKVTEIGSSAVVRGSNQTAGQASAAGSTANQAKDFKVTITLENPPATLRPGLNATADIRVAQKTGVLAVPIQAVVVRALGPDGKVVEPNEGGESSEGGDNTVLEGVKAKTEEREGVFVVKDKIAGFRAVKTGIMGDADVEILSGLQEGEEIVSGSYKTLRTLKNDSRIKLEDPNKKSWWK
jgi:HlyD family secretion protein